MVHCTAFPIHKILHMITRYDANLHLYWGFVQNSIIIYLFTFLFIYFDDENIDSITAEIIHISIFIYTP